MANRFWVGSTGTWDRTTTTHWSTTTGGAGGASAPGVSDVAIFDGASGGGTVTVTWDTGTVTLQSITCGAFTGTLDFSASDNNVTLSAAAGFSGSGSGTRTINLGDGTWTLSGAAATWNMATTTNLTFNANASTIIFTGTSSRTFNAGAQTYNNVTFNGNASGGLINTSGASTIATLTIGAPNLIQLTNGVTQTIATLLLTGTSSSAIGIISNNLNATATISVASGTVSLPWTALRAIAFTGGAAFSAPNSLDLGLNTGITITPPEMTRARGFSGFA